MPGNKQARTRQVRNFRADQWGVEIVGCVNLYLGIATV